MTEENAKVPPSTYPQYLSPLVAYGDAVILPDVEAPFHHVEFLSNVLSLCQKWQIRQCILAGDFLHLDSLSSWGKNWKAQSEDTIDTIVEAVVAVVGNQAKKKLAEIYNALEAIHPLGTGDGMSSELSAARRLVKTLDDIFDRIFYVLGNHEGRYLAKLDTALSPEELLRLLDASDKWHIAPYYYMILESGGERYSIEHPCNTTPLAAERLAGAYQMHTIVAHAHILQLGFDVSGRYYAIMAGHCVDESRLPYAAQRHRAKTKAHKLGAVIVRNGYPWLLHDKTPWSELERLG